MNELKQLNELQQGLKAGIEVILNDSDILMSFPGQKELVNWQEVLDAHNEHIGLNYCDYFTAFYLICNGVENEDIADINKLIHEMNCFWMGLYSRTRTLPYDLRPLLAEDPKFKDFLDVFIEKFGLNPYDYFTAHFIIINAEEGNAEHLIEEIKQFWNHIFTQRTQDNILQSLVLKRLTQQRNSEVEKRITRKVMHID